ncbi:Protein of unknown function [Pyronema omphalodes CBS 100304]|uniref:Uncharacterized protein n=1 Tax=Pyronema omphalodes (strain CBS 100304) TaxID=1076935 RepID=U4LDF1_PYROM|nr:Protein of unknown function [Pyronema omphalodes CBS 100304]
MAMHFYKRKGMLESMDSGRYYECDMSTGMIAKNNDMHTTMKLFTVYATLVVKIINL